MTGEEWYPGQAYVHKHNANIRRAEESVMQRNQAEKLAGPMDLSAEELGNAITALREKWQTYAVELSVGARKLAHDETREMAQIHVEMAGRFVQDLMLLMCQRAAP